MANFYELAEKALALERSGKKIIRLNVGDTNLPTPKCAIEAAVEALEGSKSGYVSSAGLPELRQRIAEREGCDPSEVVVGPGSKHLVFALMSMLRKGDLVVLPTPTWPAYGLACSQLGLKAEMIKTEMADNWDFGELDIADAKMAIICNPNNPTSTVYNDAAIRGAIERARDKYLVLDEAYRELAFIRIPRYDGAIRVRSFSKEFNMEGFRLGYAVAPKEVVDRIISYNQITVTCVPPFVQKAGIACLDKEKEIVRDNMKHWKKRLDTAKKALSEAGFRFANPQAGIYLFATHPAIDDADEFAVSMLDSGVAVAPGSGFGGYKEYIRICANQEEKTIVDAVRRMSAFFERGR